MTLGDVCHVHADRAPAERCGVLLGGARPSWSGSMKSGPGSTAWRGRCRAPRAAGYGAVRRFRVAGHGDGRLAGGRARVALDLPDWEPAQAEG